MKKSIKDRRVAIYKAESGIEAILDELKENVELYVESIVVQNLMDKDKNVFPALKVNITLSKFTG